MSRPWVLFDIDGVLNPFFNDLADFTGFESFHTPFSSWLINRELHGLWLRDLERLADLRWASMWRDRSNSLNEPYNLRRKVYPHMAWLDWYPTTDQTYKLPTIQHAVGKRRSIVWVDDELGQDVYDWADERGNVLLIHCDPAYGWTLAEYDTVVFFLASCKALAKLRGVYAHRITTRLHRVRELAKTYGLSDLRVLQAPDQHAHQQFEVQLTELTKDAQAAFVRELTDLLGMPVELIQQTGGRKHMVRIW